MAIKRIFSYILVLFGLSVLIFVIVRVMPGDTARMALGARAPESAVAALSQEMRLDQPIVVQYGYWLKDMVSGDFGESIITKRPVSEDIMSYLPATAELAIIAALLLIIFGLILGVISTKYAGKWQDAIIRVSSYFGSWRQLSYGRCLPCWYLPISFRYCPYQDASAQGSVRLQT